MQGLSPILLQLLTYFSLAAVWMPKRFLSIFADDFMEILIHVGVPIAASRKNEEGQM